MPPGSRCVTRTRQPRHPSVRDQHPFALLCQSVWIFILGNLLRVMRASMRTPDGHLPSMGAVIVRAPGRSVNNGRWLLGQVPGAEQESPSGARRGELAFAAQATQVIGPIAGKPCGFLQGD